MGNARRLIERAADYSNPSSIGSRLRQRRAGLLEKLLDEIHREKGHVEIADLGGTRQYWHTIGDQWLDRFDLRITLVNLGPPDGADDPRFTYVAADACALGAIGDNTFDLAHSNSVIEHVGDWTRMNAFAREARRLGPHLFMQTPNFWFPIEPHFGVPLFHWLPEATRAWLLMRRDIGHAHRSPDVAHGTFRAQSARLLTRKQFQALFPDARVVVERLAALPKSLIAIR